MHFSRKSIHARSWWLEFKRKISPLLNPDLERRKILSDGLKIVPVFLVLSSDFDPLTDSCDTDGKTKTNKMIRHFAIKYIFFISLIYFVNYS